MTKAPRKSAANSRGRPFEPGNPGKPPGARHRTTLAVEALLDGDAEALTRKAIDLALAGDLVALRLCLERICPPRKDRPVRFAVGAIDKPADAVAAVARVMAAVGEGEITPSDAVAVMAVVEGYRKMLEITEIEARIAALERSAK